MGNVQLEHERERREGGSDICSLTLMYKCLVQYKAYLFSDLQEYRILVHDRHKIWRIFYSNM